MIIGDGGISGDTDGDVSVCPKWTSVLKVMKAAIDHRYNVETMTNEEIHTVCQLVGYDYASEGWLLTDVRLQWDSILLTGLNQSGI